MVNSSKILTVSYGTFSCTLEGFDDCFETMKAIAEYFRDLAADDRYFGAEPPTPDAEVLARIAERELARQVDAREDDGRIYLQARDAGPARHALSAGKPETDDTAAPAAEEEAPAPEAGDTPEERAGAGAETGAAVSAPSEAVEETPAAAAEEEPGAAVEEAPVADTAREPEDEDETEAEEAAAPAEPAESAGGVAAEPEPEVTEPAETDSVAAKLRRIRSVVSHSGGPYDDIDYTEDEHAQDFLSSTVAELDAALAEDDLVEPQAAPEETGAQEAPDVSERPDRLRQEAPGDWEMADRLAAAKEDEDDEDDDRAAPAPSVEDTLAQLMADAMPDEVPEAEPEGASASPPEEDSEPVSAGPGDRDETETRAGDEDRPLGARVVKIKRGDFDAALASGHIEETPETESDENLFDEESVAGAEAGDDVALSPEDEAELQRELAAVEAELGTAAERPGAETPTGAGDEEAAPAPDAEAAGDRQAAGRLHRAGDGGEVTRIFEETDQQLDQPDHNRRRSAIQHLRAAVAATRAEESAGSDLRQEVDHTPYKSDLADVVRPRRLRPSERARSRRPEGERPAPLKLVAEQRVDMPKGPVRPRRVATPAQPMEIEAPGDGGGFAEFAEERGATRLPELLEAAAAYMADVEGRPQFSRPMLMGKIKEASPETFSREDGLRSFGLLLRQGKLQKLKGGRFAVTDATEFRADARNAG